MSAAARRFYQRYFLLTSLIPILATTLLSFGTRYLASQQDYAASRPLFFLTGGLFFLAAAAGMPLFSAIGFRLSGLPARARRMSEAERAAAGDAFAPAAGLNRDTEVRVVELDEVPFLATAAGKPDRIWVSSAVLEATPANELRCLAAHERAHLAARGWFDDVFAHWAYFTVASSAVALPIPWSARLLALVLTPWLLIRLRAVWAASREREADRLAAEAVGREAYVPALLRYLERFEHPAMSQRLRLSRLRGLGFGTAEAEQRIAAQERINPLGSQAADKG